MPELLLEKTQQEIISQLTVDQQKALDEIVNFITSSNETSIRLSGAAGVGKTYTVKAILKALENLNYSITLIAPTHKAKKILQNSVNENTDSEELETQLSSYEAFTLCKALGQIPQVRIENGEQVFVPILAGVNNFTFGDVVIVDEASMISTQDLKDLDRVAPRSKIIYILDSKQLPPINHSGLQPPVAELAIPEVSLTTPMRFYADSKIGDITSRIRNKDKDLNGLDWAKFIEYCQGSPEITIYSHEDLFMKAALESMKDSKWADNPDSLRLLSYTNAQVDKYNKFIATNFYNNPSGGYVSNEILISKAPLKRNCNKVANSSPLETFNTSYKDIVHAINNGEEFRLIEKIGVETFNSIEIIKPTLLQLIEAELKTTSTKKPTKAQINNKLNSILPTTNKNIKYEIWSVETEAGYKLNVNLIETSSLTKYNSIVKLLTDYALSISDSTVKKKAWALKFRYAECFDNCKRAYALTIHNSQGSTFDNSFIDLSLLKSASPTKRALVYTALTRAKSSISLFIPSNVANTSLVKDLTIH